LVDECPGAPAGAKNIVTERQGCCPGSHCPKKTAESIVKALKAMPGKRKIRVVKTKSSAQKFVVGKEIEAGGGPNIL